MGYEELLKELDSVPAVFAFEDIGGSVPGASPVDQLLNIVRISPEAMKRLDDRGKRGQLIWSFHYYKGPVTTSETFMGQIKLAQQSEFARFPMFLSEWYDNTVQETADHIREAAEAGLNAITYWHYVDTNYTGTDGWFKYPQSVLDAGGILNDWDTYLKTVVDDTYWGAAITGSGGGKMNVLERV